MAGTADVGEMSEIALIGAGLIGAGWAGRMVENGLDVVVADTSPAAEARLDAMLARARRAWDALAPGVARRRGQVRFTTDIEAAVAGADFIQESAPEREASKVELLVRITRACPAGALVASSSSGLLPSRLQADCVGPERVLIGHPFNPVYLLPLVELVGGEATTAESVARARRFYEGLGMHVLLVRREIEGYISDRLQEALWREALHLVNEGIATTDEIDRAIVYGPGLRWSAMGTCLAFHLAGGEAGMAHMLAQFGPAPERPWTRLEAPELSAELIEKLVSQTAAQAEGRGIEELERLRDDCLIAVLQALAGRDHGAGRTLARHLARLEAEMG